MHSTARNLIQAIVCVAALSAVFSPSTQGGALEDAQALLAEKKYGEVDKVLRDELAARAPSPEVLRVSFDAAYASGRYVTAQKRITLLLEQIQYKDLELVLLGAEVAALKGDDDLAVSRYLMYVNGVKEKSETLRNALAGLLRRGAYPEQYKQLVNAFGVNEEAWSLGILQLRRLCELRKGPEAIAVARILFDKFPDSQKVDEICGQLGKASEANLLGQTVEEKAVAPLEAIATAKAAPSDPGIFDRLLSRGWDKILSPRRMELAFRIQEISGKPVARWGAIKRAFQEMAALPDENGRLEAGKKFLSLESLYKKAGGYDYARFLEVIAACPQVFGIQGKELVNRQAIGQKLADLAALYGGNYSEFDGVVRNFAGNYYKDNDAQRIAFLRNYALQTEGNRGVISDCLRQLPEDQVEAFLSEYSQKRPFVDSLQVKIQALSRLENLKKKDAVLAILRDYIASRPGDFDVNVIFDRLIRSPLFSNEEKLAFCGEQIERAGKSGSMHLLLKRTTEVIKDKKAEDLLNRAENAPAGADKLMSLHAAFTGIRQNQSAPSPEIAKTAKEFLASWQGELPGGPEKAKNAQDLLACNFALAHLSHVYNSKDNICELARLWCPRLGIGSLWLSVSKRAREYNCAAVLGEVAPRYIEFVKAGAAADPEVFNNLAQAQLEKGTDKFLFDGIDDKIGIQPRILQVSSNRDNWSKSFYLKQFEQAVSSGGFQDLDNSTFRNLINDLRYRINAENKPSDALLNGIWHYYQTHYIVPGKHEEEIEGIYFNLLIGSGMNDKAAAFLQTLEEIVAKRAPIDQARAWNRFADFQNDGATSNPLCRQFTILKRFFPRYEKLQESDRRHIAMSNGTGHVIMRVIDDRNFSEAEKAAAARLAILMAKSMMEGAPVGGFSQNYLPCFNIAIKEAIDRGAWLEVAELARGMVDTLAYSKDWKFNYERCVQPISDMLRAKQAHELVYIMVNMISAKYEADPNVSKGLSIIRASVLEHIEGEVGVSRNDPTYDLHLAQGEFARGNTVRAWELTESKISLLATHWSDLNQSYVAWAIEQMRKQKDERAQKALDLCFQVLLDESKLEPEIGAAISLSKGDIYMDQKNFEAARIEYESLENNKRYAKTSAYESAKFRLVALYITTGRYDNVETILSRYEFDPRAKVRAEAFYYYAKMFYQQEDYVQCRDYIKKALELNPHHIEAGLLDGELRVAERKPGITEVKVGVKRNNYTVIPGRELTLSIQDQNLGVSQGAGAIPVEVWTTKGNDRESVKLYRQETNQTLFEGKFQTGLGEPTPGNLKLEIRGDEQVMYQISPDFQKTFGLNYEPNELQIKSDATLQASSGKILSDEELEKQKLQIAVARQENSERGAVSKSLLGRDEKTVRPGSSLYVQVVDPDMDKGPLPDTVSVNLSTRSGDTLDYALRETGPHTGVFQGVVPTGLPFPRVEASDSVEGKEPAGTISKTRPGSWQSTQSIGENKIKWLEVDTMSSASIKAVKLDVPDAKIFKRVTLEGSLSGAYEVLAEYPLASKKEGDGLDLTVADGKPRDTSVTGLREYLLKNNCRTANNTSAFYNRALTPFRGNGWIVGSLKGAFWAEKENSVDFKFIHELGKNSGAQVAYFFLDNKQIFGGTITQAALNHINRVKVEEGGHLFEILFCDTTTESMVIVGYRQDDGQFAPLPFEWFSTDTHPQLKNFIKPKAAIAFQDKSVEASFAEPVRLRKLRWVFGDVDSDSVTVNKFTVIDKDNKTVVPVEQDSTAGRLNQSLEISPGDVITVTYRDERNLIRDGYNLLNATLNSSFYNGAIRITNERILEDSNGRRHIEYLTAKRCRQDDIVWIVVEDWDLDLTDNRDTVDVQVTTSSGEQTVLKALETDISRNYRKFDHHAGVFLAQLKLGLATSKDTIKISGGDLITVSYLDRENTDPGVPIERSSSVAEASEGGSEIIVYRTSVQLIEEKDEAAKARLERLKGKAGEEMKILKPEIVASHPDYLADKGGMIKVSVAAPLLFEVFNPAAALNSGSTLEVEAVSQSMLDAAAASGGAPEPLKVEMKIEPVDALAQAKGYPVRLQTNTRMNAADMLQGGLFSGVIRLQMGQPGDPVDDLVTNTNANPFASDSENGNARQIMNRVPTLIVSGSDTVYLKYIDPKTGQAVNEAKLKLMSNARIELLDMAYAITTEEIFLGDSFHVRVTDPDQDISPTRDNVAVTVRSQSANSKGAGDELTIALTETLPHSGIFTGKVTPQYALNLAAEKAAAAPPGAKPDPVAAIDPKDNVLAVNFGDKVIFEYIDNLSIDSDKPAAVIKEGGIRLGTDGELAIFTKRFKDPEMAVKTRFLMAEALFEMAKEFRNLQKNEDADEAIQQGKLLLQEALRDFPTTTLAAQGEYLLANLAQELEKYDEAITRYTTVISTWPETDFAAKSQFKKAFCYEKKSDFNQACEEYVKLTYLYPQHELVQDATLRLANYYYQQKRHDVAAKIFGQFQKHFPEHALAAKSLFLSAQCFMQMKQYGDATAALDKLVETYTDDKDLRAEAMYWLGDSYYLDKNLTKAYQTWKKLTWDYPESKWAKIARGRLTEESFQKFETGG